MYTTHRLFASLVVSLVFAGAVLVIGPDCPTLALQERVSIQGTQQRGAPGRNASLVSTPVRLRKPGVIDSVEGGRAGFWIEGSRRMSFDTAGQAIGTTLPAGTYQVYPNLPRDAESASVTVNVVLQP